MMERRSHVLCFWLFVAMTACSGGGGASPGPGTPRPSSSPGATATPSPRVSATPVASATPTSAASPTSSPSPARAATLVAVGSTQAKDVLLFPPAANGNVAPQTVLPLPGGGLAPFSVAFDAAGDLYVGIVTTGSVVEFAAGATAGATPIRTISGPATGIAVPIAIAVDASNNVYVANASSGAITVYAAGASGNTAPARTIAGSNTTIGTVGNTLQSIAVDAAGTVYAATATNGLAGGVLVFSPGANGNVAPARTVAGTHTGLDGPIAIALGADGSLYAIDTNGATVVVFSPGASGDASPARAFTASAFIDAPGGLAVDSSGNVYVTSQKGGAGGSYSVFPASSNGIAVPIATVSGSSAPFDQAYGIAVY